MAIDVGVVSLVGSAIKLSWAIYDKGFNKEKSSRKYSAKSVTLLDLD